jgi:hypothetical protein
VSEDQPEEASRTTGEVFTRIYRYAFGFTLVMGLLFVLFVGPISWINLGAHESLRTLPGVVPLLLFIAPILAASLFPNTRVGLRTRIVCVSFNAVLAGGILAIAAHFMHPQLFPELAGFTIGVIAALAISAVCWTVRRRS